MACCESQLTGELGVFRRGDVKYLNDNREGFFALLVLFGFFLVVAGVVGFINTTESRREAALLAERTKREKEVRAVYTE